MHSIPTPANPIVIETAVSGVSTPSTIGQVRNDDRIRLNEEARDRRVALIEGHRAEAELAERDQEFVVSWTSPAGTERTFGNITGESVVHVLTLLRRQGVSVINVEAVI